jgi:hypothetical protein
LKYEISKRAPESLADAKQYLFEIVEDYRKFQAMELSTSRRGKTRYGEDKIIQKDQKLLNTNITSPKSNETTNTNRLEVQCYKCRQFGHIAPNCPNPAVDTDKFKDKVESKKKHKKTITIEDNNEVEKKQIKKMITFVNDLDNQDEIDSLVKVSSEKMINTADRESNMNNIRDTVDTCHDDESNDALLYIDGLIFVDGNIREECPVRIFCDGGCNVDIIKLHTLEELERKIGSPFARVKSKPLALEMADQSIVKIGDNRVNISIVCLIEDKKVIVNRVFAVFEDTADDIVFSARTMRELGLFEVQQRAGAEVVGREELGKEEEVLVEWEHCLGDEVSHMMLKKLVKIVEPLKNQENTQSTNSKLTEIVIDVNNQFPLYDELSNLIIEYQDIFQAFDGIGIKHVPDMQIVLKAGGAFRRLPSRYLSPLVLAEVSEQLYKLEEYGILTRTDSAEGSSPLVIVVKPDGSIRLAVDYRELNANIRYTAMQL